MEVGFRVSWAIAEAEQPPTAIPSKLTGIPSKLIGPAQKVYTPSYIDDWLGLFLRLMSSTLTLSIPREFRRLNRSIDSPSRLWWIRCVRSPTAWSSVLVTVVLAGPPGAYWSRSNLEESSWDEARRSGLNILPVFKIRLFLLASSCAVVATMLWDTTGLCLILILGCCNQSVWSVPVLPGRGSWSLLFLIFWDCISWSIIFLRIPTFYLDCKLCKQRVPDFFYECLPHISVLASVFAESDCR